MDHVANSPRLYGSFKGKLTFESETRALVFCRRPDLVLRIGLKEAGKTLPETDIFLSYARADQSIARMFADSLVLEGFAVWWDASLRSGETFDEVIEKELRDAKAVVVLWSTRSVASRWVRAEATLADRRNKLVPAMIEACDRPIIFELTHAADLCGWAGDTSDKLWKSFVLDLRRLVDADPRAASPPDRRSRQETFTPAAVVIEPELAPAVVPASQRAPPINTASGNQQSAELHCLEMEPGELIGDPVAINSSSMRIGRCAPAEVILPHKSVSREHCIVGLANDELFVTDQNSTNGTYIDGVRITRATILPVGSILKVGEVSMRHAVRTDATVQSFGRFRSMVGQAQQAGHFAAAS